MFRQASLYITSLAPRNLPLKLHCQIIASLINHNLYTYTSERLVSNCHGRATHIAKLAEGGFNRVFLITMADRFEVIAKIPYRLAGLRHYATASEAATLHFLHSKGIPIPKLYGHSSSEDNPVGVEYIIIEKVRGVSLQSRWHTFSKQELHRLASTFIEIKKKLFNIPFGLSGYGKRANIDIHRDPWCDYKEYLTSIARKEIEWTRRYGKLIELDCPHNVPADYISLLNKYLTLALLLLLEDINHHLNQPTLHHPAIHADLNLNTIFISPDSELLLLINYITLSSQEKLRADELYLEALCDPILAPRQHLINRAGRQWNGNLITLKGALIRMLNLNKVVNQWRDQLSGVSEDGWVSIENYNKYIQKLGQLKASLLASAKGDLEDIWLLEKGWPFRDCEEFN
ncbi:hypothetical protein V8F44DRAFT_633910 [Aspergillus fumigatus]